MTEKHLHINVQQGIPVICRLCLILMHFSLRTPDWKYEIINRNLFKVKLYKHSPYSHWSGKRERIVQMMQRPVSQEGKKGKSAEIFNRKRRITQLLLYISFITL